MSTCVCPSCGKEVTVPDTSWGKSVQCPHCDTPPFVPQQRQPTSNAHTTEGYFLVACPGCQGQSRVSKEQKGRDVQCPHCGQRFPAQSSEVATPPAPRKAPAMSIPRFPQSSSSSDVIRFSCPQCDRAMEVPSEQAGTKFPCPSCGQRLQVPIPVDRTIIGKRLTGPLMPKPPSGLELVPLPAPVPTPFHPPDEGRQLIVIAGPDKGKVFSLPEEGTVRLGRASPAEVRLSDIRVSRTHCQLQVSKDRVLLIPPEGQQVVFVNDERVTAERELQPREVLRVGESELQFDVPDMSFLKTVYGDPKEMLRQLVGAEKISVTCSCGQKLVARGKYAGTRVRCPACEEFVTLPGKATRGKRLEPSPPDGLKELGERTDNETEFAPPPPRKHRMLFVVASLVVIALIVVLVVFLWANGRM